MIHAATSWETKGHNELDLHKLGVCYQRKLFCYQNFFIVP